MQTDVNKAKSRAFNLQLRFIQLSICLLATFFVDKVFRVTCTQQSFQIIEYMGIAMLVISVGACIF